MANIQEKIAKLFPEATFEDGEILLVNIPDAKWHQLAKCLKEDAELHFDHLVTIVGMDWTDKLGCVYYLNSTKHNTSLSVKVTTDDREKPMIHSVHDVWKIATTFEREVYDFFGIIFINNPDMRFICRNIRTHLKTSVKKIQQFLMWKKKMALSKRKWLKSLLPKILL